MTTAGRERNSQRTKRGPKHAPPAGEKPEPEDSAEVSTTASSTKVFQTIIVGLVAIYPIFGQLVPTTLGVAAFFGGAILVLFWFVGSRGWTRPTMGFPGFIWVTLGLYALTSHILMGGSFALVVPVLTVSMIVALMASSGGGWTRQATAVLTALLLVHAVATLVFYVSPGLFDALIRPRFFQGARLAIDYRSALTSNSGYNAMFCALGFLIVASRLIVGNLSKWSLFLYRLLAVIFLAALVLTTKRAHPLYAILVILFLYLMSYTSGKWVKLAGGATLGVVLLSWVAGVSEGVANSLDRFLQTFAADDLDDATSGRTFLWEVAVEGWLRAPVGGHGWDSFYVVWPHGRTESYIAHNQILNSLYESGLIGTALFLIAASASLAAAYRVTKELMRAGQRGELLVASATSFALQAFLLLYGCTGGELLSNGYTFVPYFFAVAMGYSARNRFVAQMDPAGTDGAVPGRVRLHDTTGLDASVRRRLGVAG